MTEWFADLKADFIKNFITDNRWHYLTDGLKVTLIVTLLSTLVGIAIGVVIAMIRSTHDKNIDRMRKGAPYYLLKLGNALCKVYLTVIRGTPVVIQLMIIFYVILASSNNKILTAVLAFGINSGAYVAEIIRSGIMSIDQGQFEGAKAIGMTHNQTMINVILPQALRNIIPQIGNNFIINVKDTAVMSIIAFMDLFSIHKSVVGSNYLYFPSAVLTMAIYLTMTLVSSVLLRWWEDKMAGDANYDIVNTKDTLAQTSGLYRAKKKEAKR